MHSPAANSQQGERHQQQPQRHKGYDNKTEEPVVRVNKGGQTQAATGAAAINTLMRKNVQNCCRLARPLKLKVSIQLLKYACPQVIASLLENRVIYHGARAITSAAQR